MAIINTLIAMIAYVVTFLTIARTLLELVPTRFLHLEYSLSSWGLVLYFVIIAVLGFGRVVIYRGLTIRVNGEALVLPGWLFHICRQLSLWMLVPMSMVLTAYFLPAFASYSSGAAFFVHAGIFAFSFALTDIILASAGMTSLGWD
ncbi:MAG: hypothetical protein JST01_04295 [Cyanobacteria bacterium SZAS TMP-1]|nr:hypothetical protein [Cyanobacteria bacterium SZAS TMP-1]